MADDTYRGGTGTERIGHRPAPRTLADGAAVVDPREAARRLTHALGVLLGHADRHVDTARRRARAAIDAAAAARDDRLATMAAGHSHVLDEEHARAGRLVSELTPGCRGEPWERDWPYRPPAVLDTAAYVRAGSVTTASGTVPLLVPLLDGGHVVVRGDARRAAQAVHGVVLRALASTGAGQLVLRGFDPELRSTLAPFAGIRQAGDELAPPTGSTEGELERTLEELASDVRRISDMYRGRRLTLGEFRRDTGQPIETYQLVVLLDYPTGVSPRAAALLQTLMAGGAHCGISFLVHHDPATIPVRDVDPAALYPLAVVLQADEGVACIPGLGRPVPVTLDPAPALDVVERTLAAVTMEAKQAAAPRIAYSSVQPKRRWSASSADGISAVIGRSGLETVEVTLGDEREQRHNILVSGAVGQGKSNLLMVLVHSLAERYHPDELEMYLLDFKDGVTLYPLAANETHEEWLPHARVLGLESDREFGAAVLRHLVDEFERRATVLKPHGDNIARYRAARRADRMPRIVVVIDEFQVLFEERDDLSEQALANLDRLARKGRAYGIHLVLASQTLSGITGIMAKQDGIFSQFPIRLALRNSTAESRAVLDQQNTEAARLRYRGEAVVNLDFGMTESNRRAVIAVADPAELATLRRALWEGRPATTQPPVVFKGREPARFTDSLPVLHRLRRRRGAAPIALLGIPVAVRDQPVGIALSDDAGRHLSVIGAGETHPGVEDDDGPPDAHLNLAVGALQSAALSLAVQQAAGGVHFVVLDCLPPDLRRRSSMAGWARLLGSFGAPVDVHDVRAVPAALKGLQDEVDRRAAGDDSVPVTYVFGFGLDRVPRLHDLDFDLGVQPIDSLHALWKEGPAKRMHVLAWWGNLRTYADQLGLTASGMVDGILVLRAPQSDVSDLLGPFVSWKPRPNRGLLFDRAQFGEPQQIVPFAPVDRSAIERVEQVDWS